jgi:hypothetical protein
MMAVLAIRRQRQEEHARAERTLAENRERLVDMAARLVRLEAEVGIFRPLIVVDEDEEGSS